MSTIAYVDTEGPVRDWLRQHPDLADLSGAHVYFGAPRGANKIGSWITVRRIGGGPMAGTVNLDNPLFSLSCYGQDRQTAAQLASVVANIVTVDGFHRGVAQLPGGLEVIHGGVTLFAFVPDTELEGVARYVVDAALTIRSS